jgi:hypothetical protein
MTLLFATAWFGLEGVIAHVVIFYCCSSHAIIGLYRLLLAKRNERGLEDILGKEVENRNWSMNNKCDIQQKVEMVIGCCIAQRLYSGYFRRTVSTY